MTHYIELTIEMAMNFKFMTPFTLEFSSNAIVNKYKRIILRRKIVSLVFSTTRSNVPLQPEKPPYGGGGAPNSHAKYKTGREQRN